MTELETAGLALLALVVCVLCMCALMGYAIREGIPLTTSVSYDFSGCGSPAVQKDAYRLFVRWIGKGALYGTLAGLPFLLL